MSWDDLLEEMDRKMDGAMRLYVKTNERETIMVHCYPSDTDEYLKNKIWNELGRPPGRYELVLKMEGQVMDHRIRDGMRAYYLRLGDCLEEMDEEGGEEEDGSLGSFFNCNNTWLL